MKYYNFKKRNLLIKVTKSNIKTLLKTAQGYKSVRYYLFHIKSNFYLSFYELMCKSLKNPIG